MPDRFDSASDTPHHYQGRLPDTQLVGRFAVPHEAGQSLPVATASQGTPDQSVSVNESRSAWARLLAKVYEVDPLRCTRCGSQMRVLAVMTDPQQVLRILRHLIKTGAAPPGLDAASLS